MKESLLLCVMSTTLGHDLLAFISNPLELFAAVAGFLGVWLATKENAWNWPFNIVSAGLYAVVFYQSNFFSDTVLQFVFVFMSIYGWFLWIPGKMNKQVLTVSRLSNHHRFLLFATFLITWLGWYKALIFLKPYAFFPLWDSLTTCLSLFAVGLQAQKKIENWYIWLLANAIFIPMYCIRGLLVTGILYGLFFAIALNGLRLWMKILSQKTVSS